MMEESISFETKIHTYQTARRHIRSLSHPSETKVAQNYPGFKGFACMLEWRSLRVFVTFCNPVIVICLFACPFFSIYLCPHTIVSVCHSWC